MTDARNISAHLSLEQIKMKMQMTSGFLKMQKLLVIYNAIIDPRPITEIAKHTGLSESCVQRIIDDYNSIGPETIENGSKPISQIWFEYQSGTVSM